MLVSQRTFDVGIGASALSWAALGLLNDAGPPLPVRAAAASLNALVGVLLLTRTSPHEHGSWRSIAESLPSLLVAGLAWRMAPHEWPVHAQALYIAGVAGALIALGTLGRSFAILPARRDVVARGPYAIVRHPAYAAELVVVFATGLAQSAWHALLFTSLVLAAAVLRIRAEEALLSRDPAYAAYSARVRHRLVPRVW